MRKTLLTCIALTFVLAACGDDEEIGDDTPPMIDAPPAIDGPDVDAPPGSPTCATYCATIQAHCTAANQQYVDEAQCLAACAAFELGMDGDMDGNSVGCRTYHAELAATTPNMHCVHAGPGGAGVCGDNCEGFCTLALAACTDANEQYADLTTCMTECAGFPDTEPYDVSDIAGDSLACRLYHLVTASVDATAAATHCPHIVEASAVCQ